MRPCLDKRKEKKKIKDRPVKDQESRYIYIYGSFDTDISEENFKKL